ncbi:hypothetical protein BU15DRAFT_68251 [Melanogaster broomeanus]|nr:hypothetical protein BU15DRAFT_68251 [Melanogaster broomeanus]
MNQDGKSREVVKGGEGRERGPPDGLEAMDVMTHSISLALPSSQDNESRKPVEPAGANVGTRGGKAAPKGDGKGAATATATATGPGKEAMDQTASGISLVKPTSSQMSDGSRDIEVLLTSVVPQEHDDNASPNETAVRGQGEDTVDHAADCRDVEVHCMSVMSQQSPANNWSAGKATTDAMNPNTTSASSTEPVGTPPKLQVDKTTARGLGKSATDRTADGVSLAVPASSPNEVEMSMDETTNETTTPPNVPLEGEWGGPAMSGNTRVCSEGHGVQAE